MTRTVEVLAPAGGPDCLPAAVAGGAHAVYLGLRHFNARGRAENFRSAELPRHVAYLHRHGLRCYVVLNTLVHDDEHPKALGLAWTARQAGVDALIVQDLGLWRRLHRELPGIELHASTQMTVHDPSQIAVLAGLGARRVILARELALAEVRRCAVEAARLGVEVEHFVHGAMCYAYSGQCLMSNFAGCRSANRGTCAQNCRFGYAAAGAGHDTLISLKDLNLLDRVGDLAQAGVASLKIEGRLKGPDYVYTVSRAYRAAVDAWAAGRPFAAAEHQRRLREVFARTPSAAALLGDRGPAARLHRGDAAGGQEPDAVLQRLDRVRGVAELTAPSLRAGQGYRFVLGAFTGGFLVIAADAAGKGRWRARIRIDARGPFVPPGTPLFRNADQERLHEAEQAMAAVPLSAEPEPAVAVDLAVAGSAGGALRVELTSADGRQAMAESAMPLAPARGEPLDEAQLRDKLGALGGTGFALAGLRCTVDPGLFLPAAELKRLRRSLVEALAAQPAATATPPAWDTATADADRPPVATRLWVVAGSLAAARAARQAGAEVAVLDDPRCDLWAPAPPGGLPGADEGIWLRHPAVAPPSPHLAAIGLPVLAGHLGVIAAARVAGLPVAADHFLNGFGIHALRSLGEIGAAAAVLSLELSAREVAKVAARAGGADLPAVVATVHGRLPSMLTRQDHALPAGRPLAIAADAREGGLPYELEARAGGWTAVWEGRRLCAPEHAVQTRGLVDGWLLELGDLAPEAVAEVVGAYRRLRDGEAAPAEVAAIGRRHAPAGIFAGHLEVGSRELDEVVAPAAG